MPLYSFLFFSASFFRSYCSNCSSGDKIYWRINGLFANTCPIFTINFNRLLMIKHTDTIGRIGHKTRSFSSFGAIKSRSIPCPDRNRTAQLRPLRAFCLVSSTAFGSISIAVIGNFSCFYPFPGLFPADDETHSHQKKLQPSASKVRLAPGAILRAAIAASMGIVPAPHRIS